MFYFIPKKSLSLLFSIAILTIPAVAHNIEVSDEIAATLHIEPDDNPRSGENVQAWFALTHRGGQIVSLSECNCELRVYNVPRAENLQPIINPTLQAMDAEKYRGIPGANIIFPQPGVYELEISGTAKDASSFKPFTLTYTVNIDTP